MKENIRKCYVTIRYRKMEIQQKKVFLFNRRKLVYEARKYSHEPHLGRYLEAIFFGRLECEKCKRN